MKFPENKYPNFLAMSVIAFVLPFVWRIEPSAGIVLTTVMIVSFLYHFYRIHCRNRAVTSNWMRENDIGEIDVADAKRRLRSAEPGELGLVLQHDSWPPNFLRNTPRVFLVDAGSNCFWVRVSFVPQLWSLDMTAKRHGMRIQNTSTLAISPKPVNDVG